MVALGTNGGEALADGGTLDPGVHLRWQLGSNLGFPQGGFDVYRRLHVPGTLVCVDFVGWPLTQPPFNHGGFVFETSGTVSKTSSDCSLESLTLTGTQTLTVTLPERARRVQITFTAIGTATAKAHWVQGGVAALVASETASGPAALVIELRADLIDSVEITGQDLRLCKICYVATTDSIDTGWGEPLNGNTPIYLPVTRAPFWPGYPDDLAEAQGRLSPGLPAASFTKYSTGFQDELHGLLYDLVGNIPQQRYLLEAAGVSTAGDERGAPVLRWPGLSLLNLMALDPNIARILGLYWADTTAVAGTYYDYRITGHWGDTHYPGTHTAFEHLAQASTITAPLRLDEVEIVSPRPIQVGSELFLDTSTPGLHIAPGFFSAPVAIAFTRTFASISIHLKTADGATAQAWRGSTRVGSPASAAGGDQVLTFEDAAGIDRLIIEANDLWIFRVVSREVAGYVQDHHYVTFRRRRETPAAVATPALSAPVVLPARSARLEADGSVLDRPNSVGLSWASYASGDYLTPGAPVLFQVQRSDRGNGISPAAPTSVTIVNADAPALVANTSSAPKRPEGWPTTRFHYVDRALAEGWYTFNVRGIDLFGRLGLFSADATVRALDTLAPPPPTAVEAIYLDPADPYLPQSDKDWTATHGSGLKVSWEWPGIHRLQAPDVRGTAEFRVYLGEGPLNAIAGNVTSVTTSGATSTLVTDQSFSGGSGALTGEFVRVNSTYFEVTNNTTGSNFSLTVKNLTSPAELPEIGPFTLSYGAGSALRLDYRKTESFDQRIHVEPVQIPPKVTGTITAVSVSGNDRTVTTDQSMTNPGNVRVPGVLIVNGIVYRAVSHDTSAALTITVLKRDMPSDAAPTAEPAVGDAFTYYPGRSYTIYISGVSLAPTGDEAVAVGHVAVSTSDSAAHTSDLPRWSEPSRGGLGNRPGNEGPASPACKVLATRRTPPGTIAVAAASDTRVYATPADYHGRSRVALSWTAVSGAAGYAIFRASGAALLQNENRPASDYQSLTNAQIQTMASQPHNDVLYRRINTDLVTGTSHTDTVDGRGSGFYVYRIRAVDASGNAGAMSDALAPIHIRDVTPPETPKVISALGGENEATITWLPNTESDLASYRVWRSTDAAALADVRRTSPTATVPPAAGTSHTDTGLAGNTTYYYRVAAVDTNGNVSEPTRAVAVKVADTTPPNAPSWTRSLWIHVDASGNEVAYGTPPPQGETYTSAVALEVLADEAGLVALVERRPRGARLWAPLTAWIEAKNPADPGSVAAREFLHRDTIATTDETWQYRVRLKDPAGNMSRYYPVATVAKPA